jgi:arylsulfatase A-like enzyme
MLNGQTGLDRHRDDVYSEYYNAAVMFDEPQAQLTMVRTDRHKLVVAHGLDAGELYDLRDDPGETRNLWHDPGHQAPKIAMLTRLSDRMAWTIDPLPERASRPS